MDVLKELWINKEQPQGRIDITIFFINIFLIISCMFLMIIYILAGNIFMIIVDTICLIYHVIFFFRCFINKELFIGISFLEIFIHMVLGIIAFGWQASFQNWVFALIIATFLPSFKSNVYSPSYKRSFIYTALIVISYYIFAILIDVVDFRIHKDIDSIYLRFLFCFNNFATFSSIILFSIFYTKRSERRAYELTRKADYDELTDLYNRYAIIQASKKIVKDAKDNQKSYCAAILDIDHFKKINDKYGHASGDDVLKEIANILKFYSIKGLIPARWGGEEFVVVAPSNVSYREFLNIMERLRIKISRVKFKLEEEKEINLTISIGVAKVKGNKSLNDAIKVADSNLYEAKRTGRNKMIS